MGEYSQVAEELLSIINDRPQPIPAKDVPDIVDRILGGTERINCYPGIPGGGCQPKAYFISLNDSRRHGRGHLKFDKALQEFIRHMDRCKGITRTAVIVADTWDAEKVHKEQSAINRIKQDAQVEAYLISGNNVIEIPI